MKFSRFVIFLSIVFCFYALINYYIYSHGLIAFQEGSLLRTVYKFVFIGVLLLFPVGRILERFWHTRILYRISEIGSFWLAAMLYFFLLSLGFDIAGLMLLLADEPTFIMDPEFQQFAVVISACFVFLLLIGGYINGRNPRIRKLNIRIGKSAGLLKTLNIVAASDIHLGSIIGEKRVKKMVEKINGLKPDIVLLAGDILDEDTGSVIHQNLGSCLENIESRFGVFAATGNHEFIGGIRNALAFLEKHKIRVLKDEWQEIAGRFYVVGRLDRDVSRYAGIQGKSLPEILEGADPSKPILLLDHQPVRFAEGVTAGIDLQLSGHTHHGQIWPLQFFTKRIFDLSWGYKRTGNTHFYVSSGYGSWGPPVRIGNRPELVSITLEFTPGIKT